MDDLRSIEASLDENNLAKMKGLRETEDKFSRFLKLFPEYKANEMDLLGQKENGIKTDVENLKNIR